MKIDLQMCLIIQIRYLEMELLDIYYSKLDQRVENACVMLMACLRGERHSTKLNIPFILEVTVKLLQSALSAPRITSLFISLREAVFDDELKDLGITISSIDYVINFSCYLILCNIDIVCVCLCACVQQC